MPRLVGGDLTKVEGTHVRFTYKNWKGEVSERHVVPGTLGFGTSVHYSEEQWLLLAFDVDEKTTCTFAMKDISNWRSA